MLTGKKTGSPSRRQRPHSPSSSPSPGAKSPGSTVVSSKKIRQLQIVELKHILEMLKFEFSITYQKIENYVKLEDGLSVQFIKWKDNFVNSIGQYPPLFQYLTNPTSVKVPWVPAALDHITSYVMWSGPTLVYQSLKRAHN
jgi:hypothetical protein